MQSHHLPETPMPAIADAKNVGVRGFLAQHPRVVEALSWLAWLLVVALFATWQHLYFIAPAQPRWIGLTVRTGVFAIWTQVAREWLIVYMRHRSAA
ncbi:MAG TPA: hypothetical protein VFX76_06800 [Roseiflexaceae bacterium]|nr:hypothetical protein [Roseiflexaceae bacterium]